MAADPYQWHRRLGRWRIARTFIEDWPGAIWELQKLAIIMQADPRWYADDIEYIGISEHFAIVPQGVEIPLYGVAVKFVDNWPRKLLEVKFVSGGLHTVEFVKAA